MNYSTSKIMKYLLIFQLLICPLAMSEMINYHIDFTDVCSTTEQETLKNILQKSMGSKIEEIKDLLNNPETLAIEISGLELVQETKKKQIFLAFSELLGTLMVQNPNENNLITCIYDKGSVNSFAHHNEEIPFHTDGAFLAVPPRVIGIWVEQTANQGGETALINISSLLQEIENDSLSILNQPLPFHIHDSYHLPNTAPYILATPISSNQMRFRLDLLLKGVEESNEITHKEDVVTAIYSLNQLINECSEKSCFLMKTDHLYFFNNYYNLHNRESFTGDRKIWRTWIN